MKVLTESDVLRIMREEWEAKVASLTEDLKLAARVKGESQPVLAPETKIVHIKSGIRYTVNAVNFGERYVELRTPEGELFTIRGDDLEEYNVA